MDYQSIYNSLISRAKERELPEDEYTERHHVFPDFFFINRKRKGQAGHLPGDPDAPSNIVHLTPREHLLAHLLLARIHKGTRYEFGCIGSLVLMLNTSSVQKGRAEFSDFIGKGRAYSDIRKKWSEKVSRQFKGTIVAKDALTETIIGHVPLDHPNVVSGKWVHHTKGTKHTKSHCEKISKANSGFGNGRSKGYTDDVILESYLKCYKEVGFLPHNKIWLGWAKKTNNPYLTSFRKWRFDGKGFGGLKERAEQATGKKFKQKMYRSIETKDIYNKAKEQWV